MSRRRCSRKPRGRPKICPFFWIAKRNGRPWVRVDLGGRRLRPWTPTFNSDRARFRISGTGTRRTYGSAAPERSRSAKSRFRRREKRLLWFRSVWERPDAETGSPWIYSDASAHRLISDISALIGRQSGHRIIAAGDLNLLCGYGDNGDQYWAGRYQTVFDRMDAIGLKFVGPQAPNGDQASPWPAELPEDSLNLPTYRWRRTKPETAVRQLDFVFASESIADRITTRALNSEQEWGDSDHCRVLIEVGEFSS